MTRRFRGLRETEAAGFTLVELLVAIALFAVVMGIISGGVVTALQVMTSSNAQTAGQQTVRIALDQLTRDLRQAASPPGGTPPTQDALPAGAPCTAPGTGTVSQVPLPSFTLAAACAATFYVATYAAPTPAPAASPSSPAAPGGWGAMQKVSWQVLTTTGDGACLPGTAPCLVRTVTPGVVAPGGSVSWTGPASSRQVLSGLSLSAQTPVFTWLGCRDLAADAATSTISDSSGGVPAGNLAYVYSVDVRLAVLNADRSVSALADRAAMAIPAINPYSSGASQSPDPQKVACG